MKVDIFCTLPGVLSSPLDQGVLKRAGEVGALEVSVYDLHALSPDSHHKVDDYPYGGGPGMVLRVDVVAHALESVFEIPAEEVKRHHRVILLTPQGEPFNQAMASELSRCPHLVFLCGRYEGVDERIREHLVEKEISLGDFVLNGGEIAAAAILEATVRLIPGVLGNIESLKEESFSGPFLEYPHYTRPARYRDWDVPEVLLSGNHRRIAEWRKLRSIERTRKRRPDLLD